MKKINNPKVSIIIPVYNGEMYIGECLKNICNQTYKNLEIIIINDGSKDDTKKIIESNKDKRIKLINIENSGVSVARNTGIEVATGEYIMFVDADDVLLKDAVEKLVNIVKKDPSIDIIRFNGLEEKKNGKLINLEKYENEKITKQNFNSSKMISKFISSKNTIRGYCWLLFLKNKNIVKFNVNLKYLEDTLFYLNNLCNEKNIYFFNDYLYIYKYNEKSVTKEKKNCYEKILMMLKSYIEIKNYCNSKNYSSVLVDNWIINLIFYRIDYFAQINSITELVSILKSMYDNKVIQDILQNINLSEFKKFKKIQIILFQKKYFKLLYILTKIKNFIRK